MIKMMMTTQEVKTEEKMGEMVKMMMTTQEVKTEEKMGQGGHRWKNQCLV